MQPIITIILVKQYFTLEFPPPIHNSLLYVLLHFLNSSSRSKNRTVGQEKAKHPSCGMCCALDVNTYLLHRGAGLTEKRE